MVQAKFVEARQIYEDVLEVFPKNVRAIRGINIINKQNSSQEVVAGPTDAEIGHALKLYAQSNFSAAANTCATLIEKYPKSAFLRNLYGAIYSKKGDLEKAISSYSYAVRLNPSYDEAYNNLGIAYHKKGDPEAAIAQFEKALTIKPNFPEVYNNLGNALNDLGKLNSAKNNYLKAIQLAPKFYQAHNNLAILLGKTNQLNDAIRYFKMAIELNPLDASFHNNLGKVYQRCGELTKAIDCFQLSIASDANFFEAHVNLGDAYQNAWDLIEAIECYDKALELRPGHLAAENNKGNALLALGKLDEAIACFNNALEIDSGSEASHINMGNALLQIGNQSEALQSYNAALALNPKNVGVYRSLSRVIKYHAEHPHLKTLHELLEDDCLGKHERALLHYTLAKIYNDLKQFKLAFQHYVDGAKLRKLELNYHISSDQSLFSLVQDVSEKIESCKMNRSAKTYPLPIFIIGMPRSGTTLIEQIISSHSQVFGGGEIPYITQLGKKIITGQLEITRSEISKIRAQYLGKLQKLYPDQHYITDKTPHNFLSVALIRSCFPEAKIIHVKRDAAATCWSNFTHYFPSSGALNYSYDLDDLVQYYQLYEEMMNFWHSKYGEAIHTIDYDRLTIEQTSLTKNLIDYIGLEWEEACLHPHKNKRTVMTSSQQQVKKKIYGDSSKFWLNFKPFLEDKFCNLI